MTYYAWINCGEENPAIATPCVEESDCEPHGYQLATRRGQGDTEDEALHYLKCDQEAWARVHAASSDDVVAAVLDLYLAVDPGHQGDCWPDPIGWDGRPIAAQARDMLAAHGDDERETVRAACDGLRASLRWMPSA